VFGTPLGYTEYEVKIEGVLGHSAKWLGETPEGETDWVTVIVPLVETEWNVSGDWQDLLSNVTEFSIRIELVNGDDVDGLDNIIVGGYVFHDDFESGPTAACPPSSHEAAGDTRRGC